MRSLRENIRPRSCSYIKDRGSLISSCNNQAVEVHKDCFPLGELMKNQFNFHNSISLRSKKITCLTNMVFLTNIPYIRILRDRIVIFNIVVDICNLLILLRKIVIYPGICLYENLFTDMLLLKLVQQCMGSWERTII